MASAFGSFLRVLYLAQRHFFLLPWGSLAGNGGGWKREEGKSVFCRVSFLFLFHFAPLVLVEFISLFCICCYWWYSAMLMKMHRNDSIFWLLSLLVASSLLSNRGRSFFFHVYNCYYAKKLHIYFEGLNSNLPTKIQWFWLVELENSAIDIDFCLIACICFC